MSQLNPNIVKTINKFNLGQGISFGNMFDQIKPSETEFLVLNETNSFNEYGEAYHFTSENKSFFLHPPKLNIDKNGMNRMYSSIFMQDLTDGSWHYITEPKFNGIKHSNQRSKFSEIENIFLHTKNTLNKYGAELQDSYAIVLFLSIFGIFGEINQDLISINADQGYITFKPSLFNLHTYIIGDHSAYKCSKDKLDLSSRFAMILNQLEDKTSISKVVYQDEYTTLIETKKLTHGAGDIEAITGIYQSAIERGFFQIKL